MLVTAVDAVRTRWPATTGSRRIVPLKYGDTDLNAINIPTIETTFTHVSVVWGTTRHDVPFGATAA